MLGSEPLRNPFGQPAAGWGVDPLAPPQVAESVQTQSGVGFERPILDHALRMPILGDEPEPARDALAGV